MLNDLSLGLERPIDGLIREAVKDVLTEIFGELPLTYMFLTMTEKYHFEFNDIPQEPRLFSRALQDIFGNNHTIIEDLILEKLYLTLKHKIPLNEGYTFSDYIRTLREKNL